MRSLKENKHQLAYNKGCNNGCNQKQPLHLSLLDVTDNKLKVQA